MPRTLTQKKALVMVIIGLLVIAFAFFQSMSTKKEPEQIIYNDAAVRETVMQFGNKIKNVSLLAEEKMLVDTIKKEYRPFVTNNLLLQWEMNPTLAPGRLTSSPWPEKIEVLTVTPGSNNEYVVKGTIVQVVNGESGQRITTGTIPIQLTVVDGGDGWRIATYEEVRQPTTSDTSEFPKKETVKMKIAISGEVPGITVTPLEIVEDSRCPINARCIWAGTLRVRTRLYSPNVSVGGTSVFTIGEPLVWNGYTITLIDTDPQKTTDGPKDGEYSFIYTIEK